MSPRRSSAPALIFAVPRCIRTSAAGSEAPGYKDMFLFDTAGNPLLLKQSDFATNFNEGGGTRDGLDGPTARQ